MRSMNLLQMAGGVAVAGVVAAGTTAFTASGIALGGAVAGGTTTSYGSTSVTVNGVATLTALAVNQSGTNFDELTGVNITLMNAANTTAIADSQVSKIKVKFAGSGGTGTTGWGTCTTDAGTADDGGFICAVPTGPFTAITSVTIALIP